jgi:fructose-1,6-bisphosphatase I
MANAFQPHPYLVEQQREQASSPADLRLLIEVVARACKSIAIAVNKGALGGVLGAPRARTCRARSRRSSTSSANEVLIEANEWGGHLAAMASEEMEGIARRAAPLPAGRIPAAVRSARRLVSNIDVNVSIGTIFSVLRKPEGVPASARRTSCSRAASRWRPATAVYGPQTCWC